MCCYVSYAHDAIQRTDSTAQDTIYTCRVIMSFSEDRDPGEVPARLEGLGFKSGLGLPLSLL